MLTIFAVSDSIGETANQVAVAAASQFGKEVEVRRIPYVKTLEDVEDVISSVSECEKAMIISTVITVNVREYLTEKAIAKNIFVINVLGPIINVASTLLNEVPNYNPGAMWNTDETYYKRIEAMEFAMQYDDSKDYRGLKNADVVLVGLSRTSKTPLCMYLANKGIKAINIPLVPEVGVPEELYEIDKKKIFGLTINPLQLIEIRKSEAVIRDGDYKLLLKENDKVYAYERSLNNERIISVNNFYGEECIINLADEIKHNGNFDILISNYDFNHNDLSNIKLRPYEAFAIKLK